VNAVSTSKQPSGPKPLLCHLCLVQGRVRDAWTVGVGEALCVRCAVEQRTDDDMDQHNLVADLYEQLRKRGYPDAY
jgi:hypothetical protein